ncbi:MAG: hypothetical protein MMC33_008586 [Icmadophila ericetorum]|nr:hypothetical protein [Icmadophila ericetorum]
MPSQICRSLHRSEATNAISHGKAGHKPSYPHREEASPQRPTPAPSNFTKEFITKWHTEPHSTRQSLESASDPRNSSAHSRSTSIAYPPASSPSKHYTEPYSPHKSQRRESLLEEVFFQSRSNSTTTMPPPTTGLTSPLAPHLELSIPASTQDSPFKSFFLAAVTPTYLSAALATITEDISRTLLTLSVSLITRSDITTILQEPTTTTTTITTFSTSTSTTAKPVPIIPCAPLSLPPLPSTPSINTSTKPISNFLIAIFIVTPLLILFSILFTLWRRETKMRQAEENLTRRPITRCSRWGARVGEKVGGGVDGVVGRVRDSFLRAW